MEQATEIKTTGTIHYGFGAEYLPKWGIQQALREIYQNFIDYGDYEESFSVTDDKVSVKLINGWLPDSLEYLRIGNTRKDNPNSVGHHGEGLKMAFLILLRSGFNSMIFTNRYAVYPEWYKDSEIGDCFCFNYEIHDFTEAPYTLEFECLAQDFYNFKDNLIKEEDVIFRHYEYGDIVNKPAGTIYTGGLFVKKFKNLSRAYNIKPRHLPLDRDRCMPGSFDVNWATSKILEASKQMELKDLSHSDTAYLEDLPEHVIERFKPVKIGNSINFTYKDDEGKTQVLANDGLKAKLQQHNFFQSAINKLKKFLAKQLGLYDLLKQFRDKHVHTAEALQDFNIILDRIEKA